MNENKPMIIAKEKGNLIVIRLGGAINASTMPEARQLVDDIISSHKIYQRQNLRILVDYKNVTDIDTSTVANILERLTENEKHQHTIAFVNFPEKLKIILDIHSLQDRITIYDSEKEALKELKKPTQ